jgi:uncharacterized phage protein (TIGR01671 family)
MNTENLFRGQRADNNEWVEGVPCDKYMICGLTILRQDDESEYPEFDYVEIIPSTVGRSTGHCDIESKQIFSGDIVCFKDFANTESGCSEVLCIGEVIWLEEEACFCVTNRMLADSCEVLDGGCRVIGNIYDNPELVEKIK